jgi:CheY-like chemotaxis protein
MKIQEDEIKKKILVVEDEGLIAADIQKRLERLGYSVPMIAHSGEDALRCARSTPFDLVLMDIRIQGDMDGIATAQELKSLDMPVVYVTAYADQETVNRAKITEPFGYILKPIADGDLRSTVQISLYKHEMERRLRTSEAWLKTTLTSVGDG